MSGTRSIFVTNNGLSDHIGAAQVLPYLEGLSARGHKIACISVEHPSNQEVYQADIAPRLARAGIVHSPILRHASQFAGKLERFAMPSLLLARLDKLITVFQPDLLHCRSYMPLNAVLQASQRRGLPFVFDMRGFWVDERREAGVWHGHLGRGFAHHFRKQEAKALATAKTIITLTEDAKFHVAAGLRNRDAAIEVIPCSVDQTRFFPDKALRKTTRQALGYAANDVVLAHLGSAGPLYKMTTTYALYAALKAQGINARLLMVGTQNASEHIAAARDAGVDLTPADIKCQRVSHDKVPALLNAADIGLSFRIASTSSLGVSATKVGEYLSCGLPVISNDGIGDIHDILQDPQVGLVLKDHSHAEIAAAANTIATTPFASRHVIRDRAASRFCLERACDSYDMIYRQFTRARWAA